MIKKFLRNITGRDLVVGDIHGHFTKLQAQLDGIDFNPELDRLFSVGDLVDRGPESELALNWVEKPWFHAVIGNHEDMTFQWAADALPRDLYLQNGGAWNIGNPPAVRQGIAEALCDLPFAIEVETEAGPVGIVHAECPYTSWPQFASKCEVNELTEHDCDTLLWARTRIKSKNCSPIEGIRALIVGHTPVEEYTVLGNVHYIDTGGWVTGWNRPFTILDLATLEAA